MTWKNTNPGRVGILRGEMAPPLGTGQESGGSAGDGKDYFAGDLYRNLEARRSKIRDSWVILGTPGSTDKQTAAMIKKYYDLEGLEGRHRSIRKLHEKNPRRIV
jgi:hypothetical protein